MSSPTDAVIRAGPRQVLRDAGFRPRGRAFIRQLPELFHVVHFENGKHASATFGHFHVNVLVVIPWAHEAVSGEAFPSNPARATPSVAKPLGHLVPESAALPWGVATDEDITITAGHLASELEAWGLPFLNELSSVAAVVTYLSAVIKDAGADGWVFGAMLHLAAIRSREGRRDEASALLARLETDPAPGIVSLAASVRARLSL